MRLAIYNKASGAITRVVECHESLAKMQASEGEAHVAASEDINDVTHYVALKGGGAVVAKRQSLNTHYALEGLKVIFRALPAGLTLSSQGGSIITDGYDVVEFDIPGTYEIKLFGLAGYLDETLEVTIGNP